MNKALHSYLDKWAEHELKLLQMPDSRVYQYVLVVPAFAEHIACLNNLLPDTPDSILLILVANAPTPEHLTTRTFVNEISHRYASIWKNQHLSLHGYRENQHILLVDRSRQNTTIPLKEGVGLARKIGADLATDLIRKGKVTSPWIRTTDADVILPQGYFNDLPGSAKDISARIYPFHHHADADLTLPSALYDLSLHYYVEGLRWSGSPYAHHSIGSTLSVNYLKYADVRGFPRRSAGEDFYLLNKLAKVGRIETLQQPTLELAARLSNRTPFGTGNALTSIKQLARPLQDYHYYHPKIFSLLKNFLSILPDLWQSRDRVDMDFLCSNAEQNRDILQACLQQSGILLAILQGIQQYKSEETFNRYINHWFDGFRTLKFIHFARNNYLPSIPLEIAINAPFYDGIPVAIRDAINTQLQQGQTA